jgi:hypothetical protein
MAVYIFSLQLPEQQLTLQLGSSPAHDPPPMQGFNLAGRRLGVLERQQGGRVEGFGV